ncbi:hypothetical protein COCC4DRAFT_43941 [Bipolaris maydis ATCC 48331]|uniref:Uncharacterized protein n=1 Tax=Cochliobolus heterostrophus (strain C4 / ATCC 48331 / race T) TaxID=665024 RepID=N4X3G6_COCH4|nr:uncharacterized protein COCC4DRAFT_43941 [Bipolaris maydis ATCC 48331]ENI01111.1 hypothetical protein COCC4DRAFT_43941 [Bipolaris maydis ATCC 48331]
MKFTSKLLAETTETSEGSPMKSGPKTSTLLCPVDSCGKDSKMASPATGETRNRGLQSYSQVIDNYDN